eukprot:s278_g27.t1
MQETLKELHSIKSRSPGIHLPVAVSVEEEPEEILKLTLTEKDRINARCAQLSASSARTFAIAAAKASEAAQHCSPSINVSKEARCGRTMSLGLAALAGAAEAAGRMRRECGSERACCQSRVGSPFEFDCDCTGEFFQEKVKRDGFREKRCARWASGMLKELAMVWTMMSEAAGECGDNDFASNACSHFLGGTFAGLFFFSEAISRMAARCKDTPDRPIIYFSCSQDLGFLGESIDTMAAAIGASWQLYHPYSSITWRRRAANGHPSSRFQGRYDRNARPEPCDGMVRKWHKQKEESPGNVVLLTDVGPRWAAILQFLPDFLTGLEGPKGKFLHSRAE